MRMAEHPKLKLPCAVDITVPITLVEKPRHSDEMICPRLDRDTEAEAKSLHSLSVFESPQPVPIK